MKQILFAFVFFSYSAVAQSTDFILLQKHDRTVGSYYAGNHISFTTISGAFIDADITEIRNDSIFLRQAVVQQVPTSLGVFMSDTVGSYHYQYSYNDIKSISTQGKNFDFAASGASLLGGGIILAVASGVVYLADKKSYSSTLLLAGLGLATAGYFMSKGTGKGIKIGNKYKLVYVKATGSNK